jgi:hypothetical protein
MGFYGNITNAASTSLTFDLTYPNATAAKNNAATDGVFIGRYILVDYHYDGKYDYNAK